VPGPGRQRPCCHARRPQGCLCVVEGVAEVVARAFADGAALSIAQHRGSAEAQRLNEQLSAALTSRVVIEQAKGVISERAGTGLADAFARLRTYTRNHSRRLADVAPAAIDGTLGPRARAPPPRPASP
jgi:hypothetical protein